MRTQFIGKGNLTAPCDFAIPSDGKDALIVGALKGFDSTGSKLSDAVREIQSMVNARTPRQFIYVVIDGLGWLRRRADLKKIYHLWETRMIDGIYTLKRLNAFRNDLLDALKRMGFVDPQ